MNGKTNPEVISPTGEIDMDAQYLLLENEIIELIRGSRNPGQEFKMSDIHSVRSTAVKRATFNRLVRKGLLSTVTRTSQGINTNKGPGSGKSFFSNQKMKFFFIP